MSLVVSGILEVIALIRRNSKLVFSLMVLMMWLTLWGDQTSPDRLNYQWMYEHVRGFSNVWRIEFGFQMMMIVSKNFGLGFQCFIAIISLISFWLLSKRILETSCNPAFVMAIYFLFPFLLDAEQLRSFLGMSLIIYATAYLEKHNKIDKAKYIMFCLLATSLQYSCFIFFLFLMVELSKKKVVIVTAILTTSIAFIKHFYTSLSAFMPFFVYTKLRNYLNKTTTFKNYLLALFFIFVSCITIYLIKHRKYYTKESSFYEVVLKINIISFAFVPLVLFSEDFTRIPRSILILNYIVISNSIKKKLTRKFEVALVCVCLVIVGSRMLSFFLGAGYKSYIVPFFYEGSNSLPVLWDY